MAPGGSLGGGEKKLGGGGGGGSNGGVGNREWVGVARKGRDAKTAAEVATQALQILERTHEAELEWRCWLVIARANQQMGNFDLARQQVSSASGILNALKQRWNIEAFNNYLTRRDIQIALEQ